MKYLILIVVVAVVYLLWRHARVGESRRDAGAAPDAPPGAPQEMVRCAVCAVHLPRGDAETDASGRLYCSTEHRLRDTRDR